MIAELKNQDPTAPIDSTQYVSQLASYSQVAASAQTNSTLNSLLATTSLSQGVGAIGKTATSADGKTSGIVDSISVDTSGNVTATLDSGSTLKLDSTVTISQAQSSS
jgi:flagellar basal-body rod modification protein FlgD